MDNRIKLSVIYQGFEMVDGVTEVYLNLDTQEIECRYIGDNSYPDEEENEFKFENEKYIAFPSRFEINEYKWMQDFADSYPDKKVSIGLSVAIMGDGAFQRFKIAIQAYDITQEWYSYKKNRRVALSKEWCEEHNIDFVNDID